MLQIVFNVLFFVCFKVDGVSEDGTVLQFHGCFYHGCPKCYSDTTTRNPLHGSTMEELYDRTQRITSTLRSRGHTVVEMWECEYRKTMNRDEEAKKLLKHFHSIEPLAPRDGFFGGRTNAIKLYHEISQPGEVIKYVDFTSLYPWVCKYGIYPIGHPKIFAGDDIPDRVEGLLKCTILPPKKLYHPVLPYRCNGKLLFPLCRTCAENQASGVCTHANKERALTGTWVVLEITKALSMGYTMVKKHEAWHFEETERYDPETKTGGLWAPYINLWLKEKQQVI
jgi:hypothetical protein